jgi:hypothetical protein
LAKCEDYRLQRVPARNTKRENHSLWGCFR